MKNLRLKISDDSFNQLKQIQVLLSRDASNPMRITRAAEKAISHTHATLCKGEQVYK